MRYLVVSKKRNPLLVWEWDRKIHPDHRLSSLGITIGYPWDGFLYPTLTLMMDSYIHGDKNNELIIAWCQINMVQKTLWYRPHNEDETYNKWAAAWDFQQFDILTRVDSHEPLQPPVKLRNSKWCSVGSGSTRPEVKSAPESTRPWVNSAWVNSARCIFRTFSYTYIVWYMVLSFAQSFWLNQR